MKLTILPASNSGLEQSLLEQFRHVNASGTSEPGLVMEVSSRASVWQLKARLMEVTFLPPLATQISLSASGKPLADMEALAEAGVKSGMSLFYTLKTDVKATARKPSGPGGPIGRANSSKEVGGLSLKRFFASKKKAVPSGDLSFATGRGLRQAVLNYEAEFDVYAVDKAGMFLSTEHIEWEITLELFDESGLQFAGIKMHLEHDKSSRRCHARYTPVRPGNYLLAIKMRSGGECVTVCGSPFAVEVIDVDNRAEVVLSRMCLEEAWSMEVSQVLLGLAQEPEAHRRLFEEVGLHPILQMARYKNERITENLALCLENLLMIDQNKVRMVSEGSIELVRALADICARMSRPTLLNFMGKVLALLVEQEVLRGEVISALGLSPIQLLLSQNDPSSNLSAVRVLVHVSSDDVHREALLSSGLVPVLWSLLARTEEVFLQRQVLRALANLSDSIERFELDSKSFERVVDRMTSTDAMLNVRAAQILANVTLKSEYVDKALASLERICGVVTSAQIRFEWEYAAMHALLSNSEMDSQPLIGDTTYELNFYFMRILANLLQQKSEESKQIIAKNKVLGILVYFARSYDELVKNEACRALAQFCETTNWLEEVVNASALAGDRLAPLITLLSSGELSPLGQVHVVRKMEDLLAAGQGRKAQAMITYMDEAGQDVLLSLLTHPDELVQRSASIVLAAVVKNEQYKSYVVQRGGSTFLNNLMLLVKEGVVEVQRSVDYGEVEWLEIIGKGVSGVVWKGVWKKKVCAVKRFNEDNIAFDEEEFKSELAMMSVLRHPNIVHSLGGCTQRDSLFIIADLFNKGSLADAILSKHFKIDRSMAVQMLIDTAAGMNYLHTLNILHRDLKAGNLLVSDSLVVCVTDFGVSKMMTQEMSKAAGTPMYMSPEIIQGRTYTFSADTYSFAFIVWELFARKLPFDNLIPWEITKRVVEEELRPDPLMDPMDSLCNRCWSADPAKRPTFAMILAYLKKIQLALREGGEKAFSEACSANLYILDEFKTVLPADVSQAFSSNKVRRLTGFAGKGLPANVHQQSSLGGAALLAGSAVDTTPNDVSHGTKSILNLLPLSRSRKSFQDKKSPTSSVAILDGSDMSSPRRKVSNE